MNFLVGAAQYLVGPGLTAAAVSLYVSSRSEKRRARRDYLTKELESARKNILEATEYAIDYFSTVGPRTAKQEAYVILYEREVRQFVLFLTDNADEGCRARVDEVIVALVDFLAFLTGGDFQSAVGVADSDHVRGIGYTAATLRTSLVHLRDAELTHDLQKKPFLGLFSDFKSRFKARGYIDRA